MVSLSFKWKPEREIQDKLFTIIPLVLRFSPEAIRDPVVGMDVGSARVQVTHDQNVGRFQPKSTKSLRFLICSNGFQSTVTRSRLKNDKMLLSVQK